MSEVLHANVFFFITGIAVIVFTALLCVALYHAIKVLKSLRRIMDRIEEGTEIIAEDIYNIREFFTREGFVGRVVSAVTGSFKRSGTQSQKARSAKRNTELKIKDEA